MQHEGTISTLIFSSIAWPLLKESVWSWSVSLRYQLERHYDVSNWLVLFTYATSWWRLSMVHYVPTYMSTWDLNETLLRRRIPGGVIPVYWLSTITRLFLFRTKFVNQANRLDMYWLKFLSALSGVFS